MVKFAGDALLILFTGEDHARHAVHAAWNMNRVLAAVGDVHLPAARARLRMSVGVHSGTFPLLLTGDASLNVVATGGDVSRVLELQSAAPAGRILVSDETAALLPAKQVRPEEGVPGAHRLLRGGSVPAASLMALTSGRGTASERFLPRPFAERPDLLSAAPDHRWAAIAFVQVGGVPDDPTEEDLHHVDALTDAVEVAAAETGSTLLDVDVAVGGFRYFLTAGAPTTVEDAEGRLLTAVLRIVGTDTPYTLRAGVTAGRIFAGFVGAPYRQTYTVMGDSTNLAARLTARAEPGRGGRRPGRAAHRRRPRRHRQVAPARRGARRLPPAGPARRRRPVRRQHPLPHGPDPAPPAARHPRGGRRRGGRPPADRGRMPGAGRSRTVGPAARTDRRGGGADHAPGRRPRRGLPGREAGCGAARPARGPRPRIGVPRRPPGAGAHLPAAPVLSAVAIRKYRNIRVSMATAGVAGVLIGLALAVTL